MTKKRNSITRLKKSIKGKMGIEIPKTRKFFVNDGVRNEPFEFLDNSISTSKYTIVTFFPKVRVWGTIEGPSGSNCFSCAVLFFQEKEKKGRTHQLTFVYLSFFSFKPIGSLWAVPEGSELLFPYHCHLVSFRVFSSSSCDQCWSTRAGHWYLYAEGSSWGHQKTQER